MNYKNPKHYGTYIELHLPSKRGGEDFEWDLLFDHLPVTPTEFPGDNTSFRTAEEALAWWKDFCEDKTPDYSLMEWIHGPSASCTFSDIDAVRIVSEYMYEK
jgi:hypothetical protein